MTTESANGMTVLIADEGKVLTANGVYSERVYLGIYDRPENWSEADADAERDTPPDEELSAEAALSIIVGGVI